MDVKKAIEFCEIEIKSLEKEIEICNPNDDIDLQVIEANKEAIIIYKEIIILLQRGEKFEAMWELLEASMEGQYCITPIEVYFKKDTINQQMENVKQKHFPRKIIEEVVKGVTE